MNNENIDNKEINQRSDVAKIFDKYRNKIRRRKKKQYYKLDDDNLLEAEIIKEREEELKKSMRAF